MKNNKVYFQKDAIRNAVENKQNFESWYEDNTLFFSFESDWATEKSKVAVMGRMGGEVAHIKPDHKTVNYYLRLAQYEHVLHTYTITKHYYVEGMLWDLYGSFYEPPFEFVTEVLKGKNDTKEARDVFVRVVDFANRGECYEVRVKDIAKLRMAVLAVVAIGLKEEWKGLSEGEERKNRKFLDMIRDNMSSGYKKLTPEQALEKWEVHQAEQLIKREMDVKVPEKKRKK